MNSPTLLSLHLVPVSHPDLGEIVVDDCLFPIGRMEAPFSAHPNQAVSKLSRRHARIFQEQGRFYLTDLSSRNGTTLNGQPVALKPVPVEDADEIGFADIRYRAQIRPRQLPAGLQSTVPPQLVLAPLQMKGCDPIQISSFPFLVSKSDGVFSQHRDMFKDSLRYISRRHAHLYSVDGRIFVEDLGSTNGTFVNGERLQEHARQLRDGDSLAFGNPDCRFCVQLQQAGIEATETVATETTAATEQLTEAEQPSAVAETSTTAATAAEQTSTGSADAAVAAQSAPGATDFEQGTILVDKASPFLDIFYDKGAEQAAEAEEAGAEPEPAQRSRGHGSRRVSKAGVFWRELKEALLDEPGKRRKTPWVLALLLVLALAGGLLIYQSGAPEREIEALMTQGDYAGSAALAARYLVEQPDNAGLRKLANRSTLKHLIPAWQQQLEGGDFDRAETLVEQSRALTQANAEGQALLDLVNWMTELERFVRSQDADNALVIYRDETALSALIEQWQEDPAGNRLRLGLVLREVPAFKGLHAEVISHLRLMQSYQTVYLRASEELKQALGEDLNNGQLQPLRGRLLSFQQKYPKVGGVDRLLADLDDYQRLQQALDQRLLLPLLRQWRQTTLRTPPFQRLAAERIAAALPSEEVISRYFESEAAWRAGNGERAIALLQPLVDLPWGDVAQASIDRYRQIQQQYQVLSSDTATADYQHRLLRFYQQLQDDSDGYYRQAMQDSFLKARELVLKEAASHFNAAEKHWQAYRSAGGITGRLRLEESVSRSFRRRAAELASAGEELKQGADRYQLLSEGAPPHWKTLKESVMTELKRQRSWLVDLKKVLPQKLVEDKLQLLPQPLAQPLPEAGRRVSS